MYVKDYDGKTFPIYAYPVNYLFGRPSTTCENEKCDKMVQNDPKSGLSQGWFMIGFAALVATGGPKKRLHMQIENIQFQQICICLQFSFNRPPETRSTTSLQ